ncbi:MAG: rRNA maturation RNase YbeY [Peptostreptococcaceae bacterium]|jgi:probable rRNA maturation factor|nr:rRNA maturation RNase YbeY [Peptostreptococcaceae bacterium]
MELFIDDRQNKIKVENDLIEDIKKVIIESMNEEEIDLNYEISLSFVDNEEIRILNRDFRNKDQATDVLSFPMEDEEFIEEKTLGDIVISLERALEQSKEYNHSFKREMLFLVCHSMFHLMGYDHDTDENTKEMREKEKSVLNKLGIKRE